MVFQFLESILEFFYSLRNLEKFTLSYSDGYSSELWKPHASYIVSTIEKMA